MCTEDTSMPGKAGLETLSLDPGFLWRDAFYIGKESTMQDSSHCSKSYYSLLEGYPQLLSPHINALEQGSWHMHPGKIAYCMWEWDSYPNHPSNHTITTSFKNCSNPADADSPVCTCSRASAMIVPDVAGQSAGHGGFVVLPLQLKYQASH